MNEPEPTGYTIEWIFRNDHKWSKWFATKEEAQSFAFTCALHTHPDIVSVKFKKEEQ